MSAICFSNSSLPNFAWLGRQDYVVFREKMQRHARLLQQGEVGEITWSCEHEPVYTTGRRGIDNRRQADLPAVLINTDRGGETTYHGPGQIMLYPVLSLRSRGLGVRDYVYLLEQSCIDLLDHLGIAASRRDGLPGIWVGHAKIAAIGLRVSHGVVWHGMALNVSVAPQWFAAINPCGTGLDVSCLSDFTAQPPLAELAEQWYGFLLSLLGAEASR
ncbi:MAG: lipoyl(octanoyl) transferase LipB [Mariprofundaceae bacterium]|nr:lipoyl(octanoyl) transferase LipB [Mariprofundaceae bacterium]